MKIIIGIFDLIVIGISFLMIAQGNWLGGIGFFVIVVLVEAWIYVKLHS